MEFENLKVETTNRIAVVTINRPEALNALNEQTLSELQTVFTDVNNNDGVRVVIVTGSGKKAFVAGADIVAMQQLSALDARRFSKLGHELMRSIETCSKPVIAAVNGFSLGGGCELALSCDVRIASENARFSQPEVSLGVIPGFGGTQRLARLIGKGRALELLLTGDMIDADEAYRIGMVNKVVPQEELLETAKSMATKIIGKGPFAVKLVKEAVCTGLEMDLDRANQYETELFGLCFASLDQKEGMLSFLEKRPANFVGQ
ncbi:MAG: enoyl-CoA hydratase/isomerase family protein [Desulfuromonadales bacterium]|nr:enoyl-CoA hydratase/isomerase family protein [Desulfuromonadales bacterium]